ncbi:hypothetical protein INF37_04680 [Pseudoflavonifractor sp. DSM 107456]|uniref:Uncharacterized protein n=1 Tax=Pseudoflavonifractor gallinarum TaxID=2779352 RepID=A0ABR9R9B9_9FIRM|nr:hypothetical protein [Pseudoflavonifractor gallinarum]MBE5055293.1 hypothetical protein [Pseudoflavonifractor gallinarum]
MAHTTEIMVNGILTQVTEFDHSAQEIDDAIDALGGAKTPQEALANLGAGVRPTLLRNGFFVGGGSQKGSGIFPINQRGKLSYADGYTIDGWKLNSGTLTVKDDCIELEAPSGNFATFECTVEAPSNYSGKTLTLSALAERISGTEYCYITNIFDEYKKDVAIPAEKGFCSLTDTAGTLTSSLKFVFVCGKGCKIRMYAAKMEEGTFHTLGWMDKSGGVHLFDTLHYGWELSECQRRQLALWRYFISPAVHFQPNYIDFSIPVPVEMRTTPALTQSDFIVYADAKGTQSGFSLSVVGISSNAIRVRATKEAHGLTLADGVHIEVNVERAILDANL